MFTQIYHCLKQGCTNHPGMESIPETGHGKTIESAKKSHKNDPWLQGFELQGKVEKVWTNNTGEEEEQRRLSISIV